MRVSEIEKIAKEAFGCEDKNLLTSRSKYVAKARNATMAILYRLGVDKKYIISRYKINESKLILEVYEFDKSVRSNYCDNDIIYFLKQLRQKFNEYQVQETI